VHPKNRKLVLAYVHGGNQYDHSHYQWWEAGKADQEERMAMVVDDIGSE
jgi:membrane-bound inhibitor of C-type lysozyme